MLEYKYVNKNVKDLKKVKDLYYSSFPKDERCSFLFLISRARKKFIDFIEFYDKNNFIGFAYIITSKDITFLLYLAIDKNFRSKGYGSEVLKYIKNKYRNKIILNIEALDENASNSYERKIRRNFYTKSGYTSTNIFMIDSNVKYEILISNNNCNVKDIYKIFRKFSGYIVFPFIKPKIYSIY